MSRASAQASVETVAQKATVATTAAMGRAGIDQPLSCCAFGRVSPKTLPRLTELESKVWKAKRNNAAENKNGRRFSEARLASFAHGKNYYGHTKSKERSWQHSASNEQMRRQAKLKKNPCNSRNLTREMAAGNMENER